MRTTFRTLIKEQYRTVHYHQIDSQPHSTVHKRKHKHQYIPILQSTTKGADRMIPQPKGHDPARTFTRAQFHNPLIQRQRFHPIVVFPPWHRHRRRKPLPTRKLPLTSRTGSCCRTIITEYMPARRQPVCGHLVRTIFTLGLNIASTR